MLWPKSKTGILEKMAISIVRPTVKRSEKGVYNSEPERPPLEQRDVTCENIRKENAKYPSSQYIPMPIIRMTHMNES